MISLNSETKHFNPKTNSSLWSGPTNFYVNADIVIFHWCFVFTRWCMVMNQWLSKFPTLANVIFGKHDEVWWLSRKCFLAMWQILLAVQQIRFGYVTNNCWLCGKYFFGFVANAYMKNLWATGCAECEAMRQWRRPNPRPPFSRLPRCIVLLCHPLYSACIRAHRVFPQIVFCNPRLYYSYVGLLVSFWRQVGHLQTRDVTCEGITIRQMLRRATQKYIPRYRSGVQ